MENNKKGQRHNQTAFFGSSQELVFQLHSSRDVSQIPQLSVQSSPEQISSEVMPRPLIQSSKNKDSSQEFVNVKRQQARSDGTGDGKKGEKYLLTFMPYFKQLQNKKHKQSNLKKLKSQQSKLRKQIQAINTTMNELLSTKSEQANDYQQLLLQKKTSKNIMKNLEDEYEGYLTMLQANYYIQVQEEYESQVKRHAELKKQVRELNYQLSRPVVSSVHEDQSRRERVEREFYQLGMLVEKQRVENGKKGEKLDLLKDKINQKKIMTKKMVNKMAKREEQCDEDLLAPKQPPKELKEEYESLQVKLARVKKIKEQLQRRKEVECQSKVKHLEELKAVVRKVEAEIKQFDSLIKVQIFELKKAEGKKRKITEKVAAEQQAKQQARSRLLTLTTKDNSEVLQTINDKKKTVPRSFSGRGSLNKSSEKKRMTDPYKRHERSITESADNDRLQLSLRRKKIYPQLEKNMYFQNIVNHENERKSQVHEPEEVKDTQPYKTLQKDNDKIIVKLPQIQRQKTETRRSSQQLQQSIINQAQALDLSEQRTLSIQKHNAKMKKSEQTDKNGATQNLTQTTTNCVQSSRGTNYQSRNNVNMRWRNQFIMASFDLYSFFNEYFMIREKGLFSNRYLTRKGKENMMHGNQEEADFPLALTSNKYASRDRTPQSAISARRRKEEKKVEEKVGENGKVEHQKSEVEVRLEKELKDAREQIKRINRDHHQKQSKWQQKINDLTAQIDQRTKKVHQLQNVHTRGTKRSKQTDNNCKRYKQTIKDHILWLLKLFAQIQRGQTNIAEIKRSIQEHYTNCQGYIEEFDIIKELQSQNMSGSGINEPVCQGNGESAWNHQISHQLSRINMNSIFTEEPEENHIVKIMELQPLIETFNNNQPLQMGDSENKITKKLFSDSPLFQDRARRVRTNIQISEDSLDISKDMHNQFLETTIMQNVQAEQLPREATVVRDFTPSQDNDGRSFLALKKGERVKLRRQIREDVWIGDDQSDNTGLILQSSLQL